jgi:hypothetical protein
MHLRENCEANEIHLSSGSEIRRTTESYEDGHEELPESAKEALSVHKILERRSGDGVSSLANSSLAISPVYRGYESSS